MHENKPQVIGTKDIYIKHVCTLHSLHVNVKCSLQGTKYVFVRERFTWDDDIGDTSFLVQNAPQMSLKAKMSVAAKINEIEASFFPFTHVGYQMHPKIRRIGWFKRLNPVLKI